MMVTRKGSRSEWKNEKRRVNVEVLKYLGEWRDKGREKKYIWGR